MISTIQQILQSIRFFKCELLLMTFNNDDLCLTVIQFYKSSIKLVNRFKSAILFKITQIQLNDIEENVFYISYSIQLAE